MKKIIKIIELLAKNFSPLRIFQVIETENLYLSGKCLEFGASENIKKNFSYFIKSNNNFDYSNLNISTKKNFISIAIKNDQVWFWGICELFNICIIKTQ